MQSVAGFQLGRPLYKRPSPGREAARRNFVKKTFFAGELQPDFPGYVHILRIMVFLINLRSSNVLPVRTRGEFRFHANIRSCQSIGWNINLEGRFFIFPSGLCLSSICRPLYMRHIVAISFHHGEGFV